MSAPKKHSKFSASASERWLNCPGSVALNEKIPPQPESKYAAEGTLAHEFLEHLLKTGKWNKNGTNEMREHVDFAHLWILKEQNRLGADLLTETRVSLAHVHPEAFGTLDAALVELFGELVVIDFKYGAGVPVEAEENTQMIYYALGLAHEHGWNFETVRLAIVQPRAYHDAGPIRTWTLSIDELKNWETVFRIGIEKAESKNAPLCAGSWCKWCPAGETNVCPAISTRALREAQADFAPTTGALKLPPPENIKNLSAALTAFPKIKTWIDGVEDYAFKQMESGVKIPGFKLVEKRSTRKWINEPSTTKEALREFGPEVLTDPELLSPAKLEKIVGKEWVNERVTSVSSGLTLAPESDKRPAITSAQKDFELFIDTQTETVKTVSPKTKKSVSKGKTSGKRKNGH